MGWVLCDVVVCFCLGRAHLQQEVLGFGPSFAISHQLLSFPTKEIQVNQRVVYIGTALKFPLQSSSCDACSWCESSYFGIPR